MMSELEDASDTKIQMSTLSNGPKHPKRRKHHKKKPPPSKNKAERTFERKFKNYKEENEFELKGLQEWEKFEKFRNSRDAFGKIRGEKKWFKDYVNLTKKSGATWWTVKTEQKTKIIDVPGDNDGGTGAMDKIVDIGTSSGKMTIDYDMRPIADNMMITNATTGRRIYESGKKKNKDGSGAVRTFDLGPGNTTIRIQINPDKPDPDSSFTYKISIQSSEQGTTNTIVNYVPDVKGERKRYKKTTK